MDIYVSSPKFKEIENNLGLEFIPSGYCLNFIFIDNKKYVVTGGCGSGNNGWMNFHIHEVVPIEIYKGVLKPLNYSEHFKEVELKNRERSYTGMKIKCAGIKSVFVGDQITVKCNDYEKQLELFDGNN